MHGIAAITGNMHRSLRYFVLLEHITSYLLGLGIVFVLAWAYVCTFSPTRLRWRGNRLSNILFCLPAVRSSPVKQILRKRDKTLETLCQELCPEEKLVRREIRNEKDRARRRAKTKQKQVAK